LRQRKSRRPKRRKRVGFDIISYLIFPKLPLRKNGRRNILWEVEQVVGTRHLEQ